MPRSMWELVWSQIEPTSPALEAQSPHHWAAKEAPGTNLFWWMSILQDPQLQPLVLGPTGPLSRPLPPSQMENTWELAGGRERYCHKIILPWIGGACSWKCRATYKSGLQPLRSYFYLKDKRADFHVFEQIEYYSLSLLERGLGWALSKYLKEGCICEF